MSTNPRSCTGTPSRFGSTPTFNNVTKFKFTFLDTPSVKIVRGPKTQAYIRLLTCIKKYSAKVKSKLPVLISALRVSPPSDGPPHDGKVIGEDSVVYSYDQVRLQSLLTENLSWIVLRYSPFRFLRI
jgi:hypothetical protein